MNTRLHGMTFILSLALAAGLALPGSGAYAQPYPAKTVQIVVPYSAGGSTDIIGRAVAKQLSELWGRSVLVDNRPGASGMIGAEMVSRATPDGHILLSTTSSYPATAAIRKSMPFDPARGIVAVAMFARAPMMLVVHPSVPARTVKELVELAKKNPGRLNYSSSGTGGNNHISMAMFATAAGIDMTHVPYKGVAPAITALVGGEVDAIISSASAIRPQVDAGRLRAIAVTSLEPSPLVPGLPTIAQTGVPGYSYFLWWGLFAPPGLPAERIAFINKSVNTLLASDTMTKFLQTQGAEPWAMSVSELANLLPDELERYRKASKAAGIPLQ